MNLSNLRYFLFIVFIAVFTNSNAQNQQDNCPSSPSIVLEHFTVGPYIQGGRVAVFFDPQGIYELDNQFVLELSDSSGDFTSATILSTKDEFFIPILNGVIPSTTPAGSAYKLKIRSTNPVSEVETDSFEIISDSSADLTAGTIEFINNSATDLSDFIKCVDLDANNYFLGYKNKGQNSVTPPIEDPIRLKSSGGSASSKDVRILIAGTWESIPLSGLGQFSIPSGLPVGYYLIEIDRTIQGSSVEYHHTSGFIFHFNTGNTGIANTSEEDVCVNQIVGFEVASPVMSTNYPGSLYSIFYGDEDQNIAANTEYYTHSRLQECNTLEHVYDLATCSSEFKDNNVDELGYYFKLDFKLLSKGIFDGETPGEFICDDYTQNGNGTTKWVNVSLKPDADFETNPEICEGTILTATDISLVGAYGYGPQCETEYRIYWEVLFPGSTVWDSVTEDLGWIDIDGNLNIPGDVTLGQPGCWEIKLKIRNPFGCVQTDIVTKTVVVEPEPNSSFTYDPTNLLCAPQLIDFTNTSNTEGFSEACGSPDYTWTVTPVGTPATVTGFNFIVDPNLAGDPENYVNPTINFTQPGTYSVVLNTSNVCGEDDSEPVLIEIIGDPTVNFPVPSLAACQDLPGQTVDGFILDFLNNIAISPIYSQAPYEPSSYTWTITGPGVTAADYTFLNGTDASSDFPIIKFSAYKTYTITVLVDGNCENSSSDTIIFIYEQTPIITNTDTEQEICSGGTTQLIQITSDMDPETIYSISITADPAISGYDPALNSGDTIPAMVLTNSSNVPANLVYSVSPEVDNCQGATVNFTITVNPTPVIPTLTAEICSEETFVVIPVNNPPTAIVPANTTYTWTVVDNTNVTGDTNETTPQSSISQTLTNATNSVQTVEYTVTPISGADGLCEGVPFTLIVQVDPKPSLDDVVLPAICSGETFNHLPVEAGGINGTDSIPVNTTYTWTVVDANGLVTGDSNETIGQTSISQTLTNGSNVPQTLVYTVTPTSGDQGNCVGAEFTLTIVVNPTPVIPTLTAEICSEETFVVIPVNNPPTAIVPANTTYTWTVVDNTNVTGDTNETTPQSSISQTLTNATNSVQTVEYTVTPISGADGLCEGVPFTLIVQVDPKPSLDDVVLPAICSGETFNHLPVEAGGINGTDSIPVNTTYTWTVVDANGLVTGDSNETIGQTSISQTLTNGSNVPQTLVYTVTPTSGDQGNCVGAEFTLTIVVNPTPVIPTLTAEICSEETFVVIPVNNPPTAIVPANTTYTWTVVDNTNVTGDTNETTPQSSISQTLTNATNSVQTVEYTVTPISGADGLCEGVPFTLIVQVDPKPSLDDVVLPAICSGETFNHLPVEAGGINGTDSIPVNTTYTWTVVDANGLVTGDSNETIGQSSISQTLTNGSNVPQTLVYTVTPTSGDQGNCVGAEFTLTIVVNPTPTISAIPSQTICGGTEFETTTFVSDVTGVSYTWVLTNAGIPAQITDYPSPSGTGNITGVVIQNTGSDAYTLIYDISVNYEGCPGNTEQFSITVEPAPSVNFDILDQSVCSGGTSLQVNLDSDTSPVDISWNIDPSIYPAITGITTNNGTNVIPAFNLTNSGSEPVVLVFSAEAVTTSAGACPGSPVLYSITVNPAAEMDAVTNFVYCNDEDTQEITFSTSITEGTTEYNWVIDTNIGLTPLTGTGPIPSFVAENNSNDPIIATVTVDPVFSNVTDPTVECDGVQRTFTITINPSPQITNTENSQTICSEEPSTLVEWTSSVVNGTPTSYTWTFVSATTGLSGFSTSPGTGDLPVFTNLANASNAIGELVYEVIPSSLGCTGLPFEYTIFINPVIAITNAETSQTMCSEDTSSAVVLENTNAALAVDYNWELDLSTVPAGTTGLEINGVGNLPAMTVEITDPATANIDYIITPVFDGCDGTPFTYTLTVDPRPIMDPILPQTICGSTAFTTPILGADVVGTVFSWELLDVANIPVTITAYPTDITQPLVGGTIFNSGTSAYTLTYEFTPSFNGCDGLPVSFEITINPSPIVVLSLDNQEVCSGSTTQSFTASSDTDPSTTYQWNVVSNASALDGADPVSGTTNTIPSFTVTNGGTTPIDIEIEVIASTSGITVCPGIPTVHTITVVPDPTVTIESAAPTPICIDGTISDIEVSTTGGTGSVSYDWYISDVAGTLISIHPNSTDSATFNPGVFTTAGEFYFVAVANFDGSGCDQAPSLVVTVEVVNDPVLTAPLSTQTICESSTPTDLEVIATGGTGTYSYQWFSNTTNTTTGSTLLTGATTSIHTPATTPPGTVYYYCVVTTDASGCETTSSLSEVIVNEGPSISQQPLATQTVCLDGTTTPLEVDYINGVGTPTYQWYSSGLTCDTSDLSNPILGETTNTFTPPSTPVSSINYFAVLTFADGGCDPIKSACALVTVVPDPTVTIESAAPTPICIDGTISDIEVSTTGGTGSVSYDWYISDVAGTLISIHPNSTDSATFNPGVFTTAGEFYFVAVANFDGSGCDQAPSLVVTVEVVNDPVLTAPLSTQTICESSTPTDLEVIATGGTGTYSYQWFSNTTNTTTGSTLLTGATTSIHTPATTPPGTVYYYCVVTTDASGCETTSSLSEVIVNEGPSISQQPLATQTVCLDGTTTPLEVDYINGVGTPTYQWYSSGLTCDTSDLSNPILGETTNTFTPPSTPVSSINYFAVLTFADGGCDPIKSACALVTVVPDPTVTIESAAPTPICIDGTISDIEVSTTGGTGSVSYDWYISDVAGTLISIHPNSTDSATFNPGVFTTAGEFYFVAVANFDGSGCDQAPSLVVTVEVVNDPVLTAPLSTQTICESSTPTDLEVIATGGTGTYSYQWFSNTTNTTTGSTLLTGATTSIHTPATTPPGTVYYYCVVTTDASGCETTSSLSEVIVNEGPSISQQPLATQTVCLDGTTTPLEVDYINGVGTPTYQWYSSGLTCDTSDLSNPILGETTNTFTPPSTPVSSINYFAVLTFADGGCDPIKSACALVTVVPDPTVTIESAAPTPICIDGTISDIEVSTTGGTGSVSYDWYISDVAGTLISIHPNSTDSATFNPGVFTTAGEFYFVAVANFDGSGCDQAPSLVVTVEVVNDPVLTAPLSTQTICESSTPTDLEVIATGGTGTYSYQWFSNTTNTTTGSTLLTGATTSIHTPATTPPGTVYYYCVVTTDASGCETTSSLSEVIVNEGPSISQQPLATQTVCLDGTTTPLEVDYINGVGTPTYQWYSSGLTCDTSDLSNPILGETTNTFTPPSTPVSSINYFAVLTFADGGCDPIKSACALVNVGEVPVIDDVQVIICSEANFNVSPTNGGGINANDIVPATTEYTWTVVAPTFISGASDNLVQAASIFQTLVNATNTVQEVVYTVTPISTAIGECIGDSFTITVFVNPTPAIADKTLTLCSEEPFSFTASGDGSAGSDTVPANTTYTWTVVDNPNITGETTDTTGTPSLDQTLINQTNTPQLVVYTITPESDFGCVGDEFTLTVTVDPVPFILDTALEICSGEAFTVTPLNDEPTEIVPANTTYTWTVSTNVNITGASDVTVGENLINQTLININPLNVPEDITYTVIPLSGVCAGSPFEITVTVKPNPQVFVSIPDQTACSGDLFSQVDFTSSVPNTTYQYDLLDPTLVPAGVSGYLANVTGTGDFFPALTLTNTTTDPFTLTYSVEPLSEGCNGTPVTFDITINPSPGIIFSETDQELCDLGTSVAVTLTSASPNVNIQWSTTVPLGLLGVGVLTGTDEIPVYTLDNTTNAPIDLVFTASATTNDASACPGADFTYTITVNPTTTIDAIGDQIICSRDGFTDVFITSPTTPLGSLTYEWEVTAAGPSLSGFTPDSAGPIAFTTPILGETILNASNLSEDLVYTLTPFFNGCVGDTQEFTITVNPTPEIFAMIDTICSEDTFDVNPINGDPTVATIVPSNTTYVWTVVDNPNVTGDSDEALPQTSISQTLVNETNVTQDVVYTITPISDLGCDGPTFELTVTVESRPIISDKIDGICSGDTFTVTPTDNAPLEIVPTNTLYTWTVVPAADNAFVTGFSDVTVPTAPISQTLINLSDDVRIITYIVTPSSGTCIGLPFELEVTLSPRPFIEDVVVDPICSEDTFVVSPQTGVPNANIVVPIGTTYTWTVVANPNVDGESDEIVPQTEISQTLTNTTSVTQTIEYTVTPLSTGCAGLTFQVFVDVKPRPFIVAGPQTQDTQCSGSPFVIAPQDGVPTADTIVPVGTQYTWVISVGNSNLTGWSDQLTAVDIITQTLTNSSNTPQQIIYSITPEADGCVGPTFDAVITIEPKPFVSNVIQDLCDSTSYILSPVNGVSPDTTSIIPDVTLYTWGAPTVTGGITGGSVGVDEAFFDTGVLENPTTNFQTAVFTITPNYYVPSNLTTPQCIGDTFTVTITLSPSPEINEVITNIACSFSALCEASIDISPVGIAPFTYNWTSLEGNPIADPTAEDIADLCPGTYELAITDNSNCTYIFQYLVEPPTPVDFTLERRVDISCNNVDVPPCDGYIEMSLTGGTLPYALIEYYTETIPNSGVFDAGPFFNAVNPLELSNACEGNYVMKVVDANGCLFVSDTITIEQLNTPVSLTSTLSEFNGFNIDCTTANTGFVSVDLSGGSGTYNYSFENNFGAVLFDGTLITAPATILFDNLVAGDYTLIVEDPNCPNQIIQTYTLTEPTPVIVTATLVDPILCFGELATYEVTATGGVPPYTGIGFVDVFSGPGVFVVTDSNGCSAQDVTVVTEPAQVLATDIVNDALCFEDEGALVVTPTGGTGILTVSLFDAANVFIRSLLTTQGVAVQFDEFEGAYFYNVTDENNCEFGPIAITIGEPGPIEIVDTVVTQPDCNTVPAWAFNNGSICITITGGTNPFPIGAGWVDNGGGQWCLSGLTEGTYPLDVTDINGCPLFVPVPDVILTRPPEITAFFTDTLAIDCATDTATQTNVIFVSGGVPPYEITWSGGVWDPATQEVMQTSVGGIYTAFVNDQYGIANGCPPIPFVLDPITFFEFGIADFTLNSLNSDFCGIFAIDDPVNFQNTSFGDVVNFTWNFGDGSAPLSGVDAPTHIYNQLGEYTIDLTVEDAYGCFDTYSETIKVTKGYEIVLPNAFTPNGDGINETMRPVFSCMTNVQMGIYDTWGSLLYAEEGDTITGWDGTIDGNPVENGNYIMVVTAETFNGQVIEMNGPVTLIK